MHSINPVETGSGGRSLFRFADIVVDTRAHTLTRAGVVRPVEPKAFEVLRLLVNRPNELLTHEDLLGEVWHHRRVSPRSLTRLIGQLRRAMGDDASAPRYIRTRHSLGYCFIGELLEAGQQAQPALSVERSARLVPRDRRDRRQPNRQGAWAAEAPPRFASQPAAHPSEPAGASVPMESAPAPFAGAGTVPTPAPAPRTRAQTRKASWPDGIPTRAPADR